MTPRRLVSQVGALLVAAAAVAALWPGVAAAAGGPRLVVVAVPGLQWQDVAAMPALHRFVSEAAVGDLSVKTRTGVTRCGDGLLALSAGARVGGAPSGCGFDAAGPYGAHIGAFGDALRGAGLRTAAVGPAARLVVGDGQGRVGLETTQLPTAMSGADVVAVVLPGLYAAPAADRAAARRGVDTDLARVLAATPAGVPVAVVGAADLATGPAHLHVVAIRGGGFSPGTLTSVRRAPYVQLVDVAPTLLHVLGLPVPADMSGRAATQVDRSLASVSALADADRHAVEGTRVGSPERTTLWVGVLVLAVGWVACRWLPVLARGLRALAWPLAFAPVSSFLVQAVPWWRSGAAAFVALQVGLALVLGLAGSIVVARRADPRLAVLVPAGFTFAVLVVDQLVGARLQFSAPLGDNPLVAGRFHGMGNIDFAMMTASALLVMGALAAPAGRPPVRSRLAACLGVGAVALFVDGMPFLGDDFGGMLAFLPVVLLAAVVAANIRLTARRVLVGVAAVVVVVVAVSVGDYLRPAAAQTHVGRFVGDVLHGGAGDVVDRKARAARHSLTNVIADLALAFGVVATAVRHRSLPPTTVVPGVLWALALLAFLGSALNDSGVVVGAFVAVTALPVLVLASSDGRATTVSPPATTAARPVRTP